MISKLYRISKLLLLFLLITIGTVAQTKTNNFHISGRIRVDAGDPSGAIVTLNNITTKKTEASTTVNNSGKFELDLSYFSDYQLSVVKDGHYSKEIDVSTMIPSHVWAKDSVFPPFLMVVTIYKKVPNVTLSFEGKSVGKISYSPKGKLDNFDSNILIDDRDIRKEIDQAIKEHEDEIFNQKMAEAVEFEKKNQIREAIRAYEEALALRKNDQFIKPKLKELQSDLKNIEKDALLEAEFNRFLVLGDDQVAKLKYPEAIDQFKAALNIKPGNDIATAKLANAEQLLARVNADKAKADAEFSRLLTAGDKNIADKNYPEAIANFKSALAIKAGEATATQKLANAEQLLAQFNAEKAKAEAEFNRLLAAGDNDVTEKRYSGAITNFKSALEIKTGDPKAAAKLANAEQLLARLNADKAKADAEFSRLLTAGDKNVSDKNYPEAIANFKSALAIKAGEATATQKLANAEQLLAQFNAEKAKAEAEFIRLLAAGDNDVTEKRYSGAITNFKSALEIKTGDPKATAKLANAEQLLARLNADKAKADAEFSRLLTAGDKNVSDKNYQEAIANFKSALAIKAGEATATQKLANAEQLLAQLNAAMARELEEKRLLAAKLKKYKDLITRADQLLSEKNYLEAKNQFSEAVKMDETDLYPKNKIVEIDSLLAKLAADKLLAKRQAEELKKLQGEGSYLKNIQAGDANFAKSLWTVAIFYYHEALKFKVDDKYALEKIDNCNRMIDSNVTAEKMLAYTAAVKQADTDLQNKQYSSARFYYSKAAGMLPWENYPKNQLAIVEKLISSTDVNGIEAQYFEAVKKAEEAVVQKNLAVARFYFQKAISLKPNEAYPKEQLKRISTEY